MKKLSIYLLLVVTIVSVFTGCKKSSNSSSNSSNADFYFVGNIDNNAVKYEVTTSGEYVTGTFTNGSLATPPDTTEYGYEGAIYSIVDFLNPYPSVGLGFQTVSWVDYSTSETIFLNAFTTGTKSFVYTDDLGPNGVIVTYEASSSSIYSSIGGAGVTQPSSSSVNVISVDKFPSSGSNNAYVIIKADVNAVLYERDGSGVLTGNSLPLNGTIQMMIEKY